MYTAIAAPMLTATALVAVTAVPSKPCRTRDVLIAITGFSAVTGIIVALL